MILEWTSESKRMVTHSFLLSLPLTLGLYDKVQISCCYTLSECKMSPQAHAFEGLYCFVLLLFPFANC